MKANELKANVRYYDEAAHRIVYFDRIRRHYFGREIIEVLFSDVCNCTVRHEIKSEDAEMKYISIYKA